MPFGFEEICQFVFTTTFQWTMIERMLLARLERKDERRQVVEGEGCHDMPHFFSR